MRFLWVLPPLPPMPTGTPEEREIVLPPYQVGGPETTVRKIGPPLDFAAVTDHSEFLGELELCADEESAAYGSRSCETYRKGGPPAILVMARGLSQDLPSRNADICGEDGRLCLEASATRWRLIGRMAEEAYDRSSRCEFTTFVAYEHSGTPDNNPYHRNVIFRNGWVPRLPTSYFEAATDIELWDRLTSDCLEGLQGCDVLAIPHSSNLSSGTLFSSRAAGSDSRQAAGELAARRNRLEPVMEIIQHKGSSECFNGFPDILGEPDLLCDMEQLRRYYRGLPAEGNAPPICDEGETGRGGALNLGCVSKNDFFRSVLLTGLQNKQMSGVNPFKFGVIGSTDNHLSTAGAVDESGWQGHTVSEIDGVERLTASRVHASGLYTNPGGLAGIWAVENSRDALFDALQRREVFGTSGPRIGPRSLGAGISRNRRAHRRCGPAMRAEFRWEQTCRSEPRKGPRDSSPWPSVTQPVRPCCACRSSRAGSTRVTRLITRYTTWRVMLSLPAPWTLIQGNGMDPATIRFALCSKTPNSIRPNRATTTCERWKHRHCGGAGASAWK